MEYYRTEDGQIQSDLAFRSSKILHQYRHLITAHEKYEVSLCIMILQNLLTNCIELFNSMSRKDKKTDPFRKPLTEYDPWGLMPCVVKNTFRREDITIETVFRHLRNALSHPTKINLNAAIVSTGYTTEGKTSSIEKVIFVSSPDVKISKQGYPVFRNYQDRSAAEIELRKGPFPEEVSISQTDDGKYAFFLNEIQYHRMFRIELTPDQIFNMTLGLCIYLSHPLYPDWDGKSFNMNDFAA